MNEITKVEPQVETVLVLGVLDNVYLICFDGTVECVYGSSMSAVATIVSRVMSARQEVVVGGLSVTVATINADAVSELFKQTSRAFNPSKPFPVQPSPAVGLLIWGAARVGILFKEVAMAKSKSAKTEELSINLMGFGFAYFEQTGNNQLKLLRIVPAAGVEVCVESVIQRLFGVMASPIQNDQSAAQAAAQIDSDIASEAVIAEIAPATAGEPKTTHPKSINPLPVQPELSLEDDEQQILDEIVVSVFDDDEAAEDCVVVSYSEEVAGTNVIVDNGADPLAETLNFDSTFAVNTSEDVSQAEIGQDIKPNPVQPRTPLEAAEDKIKLAIAELLPKVDAKSLIKITNFQAKLADAKSTEILKFAGQLELEYAPQQLALFEKMGTFEFVILQMTQRLLLSAIENPL